MAMNRLSPEIRTEEDQLRFVFAERRSPQATEHLNALAQQQQHPSCHLCGEAEKNLCQADEDGGKRLDDPEGE